jgi:flagellar hook assembly protein FlgD
VDASNNKSGSNDFAVSFEVIHQSTITEVMNYPNPFTTSTKFVFTLTGSELPTWFKIQIMTVSGKIVREITQQELGPLRIGKNITEFAWDGTDEYGDPLGNGVYFYKVFTRINEKEIEHRASGADAFFKHEFGKMYLMR